MTVAELGRRMTSAELSEWMAYDSIDPLPDPHFSAGVVAATFANVMGGGPRRFTPVDFIPSARPGDDGVQPCEVGKAKMRAFAAAHNGRTQAKHAHD